MNGKVEEHEDLNTSIDMPLEIKLRSYGASGYEWRAVFDPRSFCLQDHSRVPNLKEFGARGTEVFRFKPITVGDHEISFELIRPVEDKAVERKEYLVHVTN